MLKRVIEIILGLIIAFSLFTTYGDDTNPSKLTIWYILSTKVLQTIVWIVLFFLASRLIWGRSKKDYSTFFTIYL